MKTILTVPCLWATALALVQPVEAQFILSTNNGAITIIQYVGSNNVVVIPNTTNGWPVTEIWSQAFFDATNLTSVTIPDSITNIGFGAFERCTSLTNVTIPNSVGSIGTAVFEDCTSLTSVTFPASLASIVNGMFDGCSRLPSITIPDGVTNIGDNAFQQCYGLSSVTIPGSVVNIGAYAFFYCTNLTGVTIPDGVSSIGPGAFQFCSGLTSVTIPKSVGSIGEYAFGAAGLTAILVNATNAVYSSLNGVLFNKSRTTLIQYPGGKAGSYSIPATVTAIGGSAFEECFSLTNVTIPDGVDNIGDNAFNDCSGLSSLTIPGSVTNLGPDAFFNCDNVNGFYFLGDPPALDGSSVFGADHAIVYYLPGTTGWGPMFGGLTTMLWNPQVPINDKSFGVRSNQFGFDITGTSGITVVLEVSTNLASSVWTPLRTMTLTNGLFHFSEPLQPNISSRLYRLSPP